MKHWFIANSEAYAFNGHNQNGVTAEQYCTNLPRSYRVPAIVHYTNAKNQGSTHWPYNYYLRMIGEGIFSEWGNTSQVYYTDSDWQGGLYYWTYNTSAVAGPNGHWLYAIRSNDGSRKDTDASVYSGYSVACVML